MKFFSKILVTIITFSLTVGSFFSEGVASQGNTGKKVETKPVQTAPQNPTATSTPVPTFTGTPVPTATNTPVPTNTATPTPTNTATPSPTNSPSPSPTPLPTATAKPTATNTPVPTATNTPVPTATNTPVPTATNTPTPTNTSTPVPTATNTPMPTATNTPTPTNTATPVPTEGPKSYDACETLEELFLTMIENGEMGKVDISRFKSTSTERSTAWNNVINGAGKLGYSCCDFLVTVYQGKSVYLCGMDAGFSERYAKVKQSLADAMELVEEGMSEMDKALVLHEYLMDKATYVKNSEGCYNAWGILANGEGVCMSYSLAYEVLLNQVGIEAYHYVSDDMNHMWTIVKIDGQWYQVDATWDDTRVKSTGRHYYFMRTDDEFENVLSAKHYNYYVYQKKISGVKCTDTTYTNWFVHDVKGRMVYSDGYWYYADGNKLMKARIDGSDMQVVATEDSAITVEKVENGEVIYRK